MAPTSNNFFQRISTEFGSRVKEIFKSYATNTRKLANMTSRKKFLVRCRRRGIMPNHIVHSFRCVYALLEQNSPFYKELDKCINKFKKSILNIEIKQTYHSIGHLQNELSAIKSRILAAAPEDIAENFFRVQEEYFQHHLDCMNKTTKRKFDRILATGISDCNSTLPTKNDKAIHNATTVTLPVETEILLSLGPKFSLPYSSLHQVPFYHVIADLENIINTSPDSAVRNRNRSSAVNIMQNFIHGFGVGSRDPLSAFLNHACKV